MIILMFQLKLISYLIIINNNINKILMNRNNKNKFDSHDSFKDKKNNREEEFNPETDEVISERGNQI